MSQIIRHKVHNWQCSTSPNGIWLQLLSIVWCTYVCISFVSWEWKGKPMYSDFRLRDVYYISANSLFCLLGTSNSILGLNTMVLNISSTAMPLRAHVRTFWLSLGMVWTGTLWSTWCYGWQDSVPWWSRHWCGSCWSPSVAYNYRIHAS